MKHDKSAKKILAWELDQIRAQLAVINAKSLGAASVSTFFQAPKEEGGTAIVYDTPEPVKPAKAEPAPPVVPEYDEEEDARRLARFVVQEMRDTAPVETPPLGWWARLKAWFRSWA